MYNEASSSQSGTALALGSPRGHGSPAGAFAPICWCGRTLLTWHFGTVAQFRLIQIPVAAVARSAGANSPGRCWALSWKASVLASGTGGEKCVHWREALWWCWRWEQQRWVSVRAGAQLPSLLGLGTSAIKMAIAFQSPGICIGLGRGVGQCLHYQTERKTHIVLASVLGRQRWLVT